MTNSLLIRGLVAGLCLTGAATARAAPAPAEPAEVEPTTITMGCLSNSCGARSPAVAAAIKAGDARAVVAAGGTADDVLATFSATRSLGDQIKPGSAQFVDTGAKTGAPSVRFDMQDGRSAIVTEALLAQTPGGQAVPTSVVYGLPPGAPMTLPPLPKAGN